MTYLNQAGTSWPKPQAVRLAVQQAMDESHQDWADSFEAQHGRVARAFGAAPERLLLTPGCTSALATAIADVDWREGDRVVTSGLEHHALHRPVTLLERRGVQATAIGRPLDAPIDIGAPIHIGATLDLDALGAELERGGVRLVAMTAACNVTGELLPIREATELAHAHGALMLVDAAQIAGWLPIDVEAMQVDLLAFAGHKGLRAPWGIGGLYVAPHVALASPAATCALPVAGAAPAPCAPMPGYCDVGSVDRFALAGLSAALDDAEPGGTEERLHAARALLEPREAFLDERTSIRPLGARDPRARLPTVAFTVEGRTSTEALAAFGARNVVVAGGLQCAPLAHRTLGTEPDGAIRVSVGPSNDARDVERAIEVLDELCPATS